MAIEPIDYKLRKTPLGAGAWQWNKFAIAGAAVGFSVFCLSILGPGILQSIFGEAPSEFFVDVKGVKELALILFMLALAALVSSIVGISVEKKIEANPTGCLFAAAGILFSILSLLGNGAIMSEGFRGGP